MKGALAAVLCLAACARAAAPVAVPVRHVTIPAARRSCPPASPLPAPPRRLRTTEEIAAWARQVVVAYEQTRAARNICAASVVRLARAAETISP